jgi:drug/metabolite transporter (DMT)-like permease
MLNWILFIAAGLIWGSSFLLIKVGVRELDALSLVTGRIVISALVFGLALLLLRKRIPRDGRTLFGLALIGLLNTALPFVLITWAEQYIDSSLAGVLNGTVPLFSLVIAHLALADDKIDLNKLLGLIAGFAGVVILTVGGSGGNPSTPAESANGAASAFGGPLAAQLAMLAASLCYALSAVYIRRNLRHVEPITIAGTASFSAAAMMLALTLAVVRPLPVIGAFSADVVLAVITLGVVNTFVANSMYYVLLRNWGASRATMVTYLPPPVSIALGALVAREAVTWRLIIGAMLIVGGVAVANWKHLRALFAPSAVLKAPDGPTAPARQ